MMKKTFIPNWYLSEKNILSDKKIKMWIMAILLVNILLLALILNISNKINIIDKQPLKENTNNNVVQTFEQDISTIEKYKQFSDFLMENNLRYNNIVITKSGIEIDIEVTTYKDYIYAIKCIEKEFSIKKLTQAIKNGENFNFKVIVGV